MATAKKEVPANNPSGHVFGIKGKQRDETRNFILDETGKPKQFKGDESELIGTGEDYEKFQGYIIRMEMDTRPSTMPGKSGDEGFVTKVFVVRPWGGVKKIAPENAAELNDQFDFRNVGNPHEAVWLFPVGSVKAGDEPDVKCIHVPHRANGRTYYNYRMVITPKA